VRTFLKCFVFVIFDVHSLFSAAKCFDQAALVCKELGQLQEIADLAERACNMYQQHGSPDSGAMCLEKAAKMIEQQNPDRAIDLYRRGVDVVLVSYIIPCCYV
jgi:hypothetical protein